MLRKIECFIQPFKLDDVIQALMDAGCDGITVSEVKGFGKRTKVKDPNKIKFNDKIKVEMFIDEERVDDITSLIVKLARTGDFGSGKIFVIPVEDAIRIRTSETGRSAII